MTVLGLIVLFVYAVFAATVLPGWVVSLSGPKADENHRLDAIANARGALLGVLAPVVVAIGAVAAFLNYRETAAQNRRTVELSRDTLRVTERGQLTERFTRAIEQLGDNRLDVRLGGIYALEQIALDSTELHWPVMEVLTAFLRERAPARADAETEVDTANRRSPADHQAIATVLGRRRRERDPAGQWLDLHEAILSGVRWRGANLGPANLNGADLRGAKLRGANLERAHLRGANLERARLHGANLKSAVLRAANLEGADLSEALLEGADLHGARGLTKEQLQGAADARHAHLPDDVARALDQATQGPG